MTKRLSVESLRPRIVTRDCAFCGVAFIPPQNATRHCGLRCGRAASALAPTKMFDRAAWNCLVPGCALPYRDHPKCGGLATPNHYGQLDALAEHAEQDGRSFDDVRRCGLLVGPGHLFGLDALGPDGRCRDCRAEEARRRARAGLPYVPGRYSTDWTAPLPSGPAPVESKPMAAIPPPRRRGA